MKRFIIAGAVICLFSGCKSVGRLVSSLDTPSPVPLRAQSFPADPNAITFLIAGQSNAESLIPSITSTTGMIYVKRWSSEIRETSYTRAVGVNHSAAFIVMADLIQMHKKLRKTIRIINVGEGGTNSGQWAEGFKDRIKSILLTEHVDAILWVQGESDVWGGFSQAETYENYKTIFSVCTGIPVYVALDSLIPPEAPYPLASNPIRAAQAQIIREGYALPGPDLDPLRYNASYMDARGVHFQGAGLIAVGTAWAEVVKWFF